MVVDYGIMQGRFWGEFLGFPLRGSRNPFRRAPGPMWDLKAGHAIGFDVIPYYNPAKGV